MGNQILEIFGLYSIIGIIVNLLTLLLRVFLNEIGVNKLKLSVKRTTIINGIIGTVFGMILKFLLYIGFGVINV